MLSYLIYTALAVNAVTFLAFGLDKRQARLRRSRVSERSLLALSWATGFLGGWMGMTLFRHKTRKTGFKVKMVFVTILNLLWGLVWLALRVG
jgi:uncharacterized membrane protein YsdA (DUF1294 family)